MKQKQLEIAQSEVIDFLVRSEALRFGNFSLKSGRQAPYFINAGCFDDGQKILQLARFYAQAIVARGLSDADVVFGPAYKGIPLCVSTAMCLAQEHGVTMGFCFNRKEAKSHGEKGMLVGKPLVPGMRVVLVEDVVTAGTTFREVIPMLRSEAGVTIAEVIILVDRDERGTGDISAVKEAERELGITITPIVRIDEIIDYLSTSNTSGFSIDDALMARIRAYRREYGAICV